MLTSGTHITEKEVTPTSGPRASAGEEKEKKKKKEEWAMAH
jgi:hypothetical protein